MSEDRNFVQNGKQTFGERLKERRIDKGLTQGDLAKQLNVAYQTISKYERDVNKPDPAMLSKLADILDCSTDFLTFRNDNPDSKLLSNEEYSMIIDKTKYPHDITPAQLELLFDKLKEYRFDIDSLIKDIKDSM